MFSSEISFLGLLLTLGYAKVGLFSLLRTLLMVWVGIWRLVMFTLILC